MRKQIVHISVHQTSKILALMNFILLIIVMFPSSLWMYYMSGDPTFFGLLVIPFIYLILGYIAAAIFCWLYNVIARGFGGVEFELLDPEEHPGTEV